MPYNELIKLKNAFSQLDVIDQNLKMRHLRAHLTLAIIIIYANNLVRKALAIFTIVIQEIYASNVGDKLFSSTMYTIT